MSNLKIRGRCGNKACQKLFAVVHLEHLVPVGNGHLVQCTMCIWKIVCLQLKIISFNDHMQYALQKVKL